MTILTNQCPKQLYSGYTVISWWKSYDWIQYDIKDHILTPRCPISLTVKGKMIVPFVFSTLLVGVLSYGGRFLFAANKIKAILNKYFFNLKLWPLIQCDLGDYLLHYPGCPHGFIRWDREETCYLISDIPATRYDAQMYCKAFDSNLVSIESEMENYFLKYSIHNKQSEPLLTVNWEI